MYRHRYVKQHDAFQKVQGLLCYSNEGYWRKWKKRGAVVGTKLEQWLDHEGTTVFCSNVNSHAMRTH